MSENGQTHFKTLQSKGLSNYNFKFETGERITRTNSLILLGTR